jgi:protein TIF31
MGISYLSTLSGDLDINPERTAQEEAKGVKSSAKKPATKPATTNASPNSSHPFSEYDFELKSKEKLEHLIPENFNPAVEACVKSLSVSVWNPPPPQARMSGDIMYLTVTTLENVTLYVTASVTGFFVNRCTDRVFDPAPRSPKPFFSHTLPGLLNMASSLFKTRFSALQSAVLRRLPQEYLLSPIYRYPWATRTPTHEPDAGRALDVTISSADAADLFAARDWNEDIQGAKELPRSTPQERILRDTTIFRHHADFVEAATKGAMAVVNGSLQPINPGEPENSLMFIHGNIFFSRGNDQRESFDRFGGDNAAHVAVSKDVDGVGMLNLLDLEGVHTLGTALVDYKGQRLVAQTIVPGILRRTQQMSAQTAQAAEVEEGAATESSDVNESADAVASNDSVVVYGSIDGGKTVASDPKFHDVAGNIAKYLHLEEHDVVDSTGKAHKLFTSVDAKGIVGNDGRRYLLDLPRLHPTDIEFIEEVDKVEKEGSEGAKYPHRMILMRAELVESFYEYKLRQFIQEHQDKMKKADEEKKAAAEKRKENGEAEAVEDESKSEEEEKVVFDFRYNPDAFALMPATEDNGGELPSAELDASKETVRTMSRFLRSTLLPSAVVELATDPTNVPFDTERLTAFFHSRGINMRYLGRATQLLEKFPREGLNYAKDILREEMVSRASKSVLREYLKDTPMYLARECISNFMNCLYFPEAFSNQTKSPVNFSHPMHSKGSFTWESLTPAALHTRLQKEIESRFRYTFTQEDLASLVARRHVPLMRSIALKVGIQFIARDKDWTSGWHCFSASDIVNLYPIVKHAEPRSHIAIEVAETASHTFRQTQKAAVFLEMLMEHVSICEQVYSPIHPETLKSYKNLASSMLMQEGGNAEENLEACKAYQRKAVIVAERTLGLDDQETLAQYVSFDGFLFGLLCRLNLKYLDELGLLRMHLW